jgi:Asp-tRNA(Asn)/Glu-tRNA(Gln) amidotransferase A subunit family amidase
MRADRTNAIRSEPAREEVLRAREIRQSIWQSFSQILADNDFLLSPTVQYVAPTREQWASAWERRIT